MDYNHCIYVEVAFLEQIQTLSCSKPQKLFSLLLTYSFLTGNEHMKPYNLMCHLKAIFLQTKVWYHI